MKRRTLLIASGIFLAIALIAGLVALSYVQRLMAPKPLTITYSTEQTIMPADAACAGGSDKSIGVAKEVFNLETKDIYVAGGANPMPDAVWADYHFWLPYLKNSTRHLLFDGSCFFRSPDAPADCTGDACFNFATIVDYSWLKLTTVVGNSCFPDASGCSGDQVNPGYVSINTIAKCQRVVFEGPIIYELADGKGNRYVMHATMTGVPDVTGPTLPAGWTLTERTIDEPLVLLPFGAGDNCYYNVVRDNLVQSYHQYVYASEQYPE